MITAKKVREKEALFREMVDILRTVAKPAREKGGAPMVSIMCQQRAMIVVQKVDDVEAR